MLNSTDLIASIRKISRFGCLCQSGLLCWEVVCCVAEGVKSERFPPALAGGGGLTDINDGQKDSSTLIPSTSTSCRIDLAWAEGIPNFNPLSMGCTVLVYVNWLQQQEWVNSTFLGSYCHSSFALSTMQPQRPSPNPLFHWKWLAGFFLVACITFRAVALVTDAPHNQLTL